jgi:hypothetical protein
MKILILLIVLLSGLYVKAQTPQFAVVRPNGTSYIFPTWDAAYAQAVDGDNIYLPGILIQSGLQIDKKLNIYGAGHHPDSTSASGKTSLLGGVYIGSSASGGSIEGVQLTNYDFYFSYSNRKIRDYTIKRCRSYTIFFGSYSIPQDSLPTNIKVIENIFVYSNGYNASGNSFQKNLVFARCDNFTSTFFKNNVFLLNYFSYYSPLGGITYSTFENNVFCAGNGAAGLCTNSYYNNLVVSSLLSCQPNTVVETNTITVASTADIFINYNSNNSGFPYLDNYHLKPSSIGRNAGTDGTDVGIYGTPQPTSEGWLPSNPHIYYKQIAPQTGSDGKLNVRVKVRTNN